MKYSGNVQSPIINGDIEIDVNADEIMLTSIFDAYSISYAEINSYVVMNYAVIIRTGTTTYIISQLGNSLETFYLEMCDAYNTKVRQALFVQGAPYVHTEGEYRYCEDGQQNQGTAQIELYGDCIVILPSNDDGRRVPLCFISAVERKAFELTLRLLTG